MLETLYLVLDYFQSLKSEMPLEQTLNHFGVSFASKNKGGP